ncbi:co-chaperone GroES [Candidatus Saccharibacteria bacterium]|jgi:chaperonin GroES|nr:co-chaperone GroES [Candidatus Saccharibacteria bacterium]
MSSPLHPLSDWVVAEQEEAETKTASGLYLPDKATEKPKVAKVLKVGKDVKEIKIGDRIVYKSYSTNEVKINDKEYILVKEEDVIATVK